MSVQYAGAYYTQRYQNKALLLLDSLPFALTPFKLEPSYFPTLIKDLNDKTASVYEEESFDFEA